jgi:hypothetical protein
MDNNTGGTYIIYDKIKGATYYANKQLNNYVDTETLFEKYEIENEDFMYIWKNENTACSLHDYSFLSAAREIRA